jgi:phosphohistidine phosphatase
MELYLLRHAHAGDPAKWTGDDGDRPISPKGRGQAERLGRLLAAIEFKPDAILTSPLVRAEQTARIVADALGRKVRVDDRLAAGFDLVRLRALVDEAGDAERIVVVGHDPDFTELLADLTGAPSITLRKGTLARVDVDGAIESGAGILRWLVPPDLLQAG